MRVVKSLLKSTPSRVLKFVLFEPTSILGKLIQPEKAEGNKDVTESGITTEDKLVQFANALSPIEVTESGITIEDKLVQFTNA